MKKCNKVNVTFLRHAQTNYNVADLFCGISNCDITPEGANLAKNLRNELPKFDVIICSSLKRTHQTLQAIFPGASFIIDKRVDEISLGEWEGKRKKDVNQYLRNEFKKGNFTPKNAESNESVEKRITSFLDFISKTYNNNENILVITHNGFMRTFCRMYNKKPIKNNLEYFTISL